MEVADFNGYEQNQRMYGEQQEEKWVFPIAGKTIF